MSLKKTVLLLIVIASFILMTYQSKKGKLGPLTPVNNLFASVNAVVSSATDSVFSPFRKLTIREEETLQLRKRVDELMLELGRSQEAVLENRRLRELLKLRETQHSTVAAARVISRGIGYREYTLVLDKGAKDGVAKDMTVMTPLGLTGKIISVSDSFSSMLWISDINFSAAVRTREGRREGVLSGTGSRACLLKYVPYEDEIKTGDVVITSGLDAFYPQGIPVGYVSKVDAKGVGGNFQYIEITPFQDPAKMEEVLIVK